MHRQKWSIDFRVIVVSHLASGSRFIRRVMALSALKLHVLRECLVVWKEIFIRFPAEQLLKIPRLH